jgi:hypothetical protein
MNFYDKISEQLENNINEYLNEEELSEVQSFNDLYDLLEEKQFFWVEIIYYHTAMDYLRENDSSLYESMALASEYDYRVEDLNSELLASLLATQNHRESFEGFRDEIEEYLTQINN